MYIIALSFPNLKTSSGISWALKASSGILWASSELCMKYKLGSKDNL